MTAKWTLLVWLFARIAIREKEDYELTSDNDSI
jgi:hypothetical protein